MSEDWTLEYSECSEDRRHLTDIAWQIPSTIIIVNGVLLGLAYDGRLKPPISGLVIIFGAFFSLISSLNVCKFAYRSERILKRLMQIEEDHHFGRFKQEPVIVGWRLAIPLIAFLSVFTIFLFHVGGSILWSFFR